MAEIKRKSLCTGRSPPTGRISPCSNTRSSFTCSDNGMSATSSRKIVPPWACSSRPLMRLVGAGECTAGVAEQLALGQRGAERGHVDGHERPVGSAAIAMDGPRRKFLARAAFALQVDARVGRRAPRRSA